jgi:hypothetical protein
MTGYQRPVDAPISASWQDHRNRNPPSSEPGTDYACAYGTPIAAAGEGVVVDYTHSTAGGTGRYLTIDLDDGRRVRYLHLAEVWLGVGVRVAQGQHVALSGASGWGSEWGYGAHVHTTLFPGRSYDFGNTLDFETYVEEDMTPDQAHELHNVYAAIFTGGNSMPDGGRSLAQSLADLTAGTRPAVSRYDSAGNLVNAGWVQELADVKSNQLHLQATHGSTRSLVVPAWLIAAGVLLLGLLAGRRAT